MTLAPGELQPSTGPPAAVDTRAGSDDRAVADGPDAGSRAVMIAPLVTRIVGAIVFTGFPAIAFVHLLIEHTSAPRLILSVPLLLATTLLQIFYFSRPGVDLHSPLSYAVLVVQALLSYLPLWFLYGEPWIGMPLMVAGTALLVLPRSLRWVAYAAVVVSTAWTEHVLMGRPALVAYIAVSVAVFGLQIYGLTLLVRLITELHLARSELARSAVADERRWFARRLHDLLGQSLSAIAPKCERASRLVSRDPELAQKEVTGILGISRRTLTDVRALAHGYRDIDLDEESRTAEAVLAASRVDVRMERSHGDLPAHLRTVLAAVLREGVATVVQQSTAERCDITMREDGDRVSLDIVSDGIGAASRATEDSTLAARVAELGGDLTTGTTTDGRYRLHVSLPLSEDEGHDSPAENTPHRSVTAARSLVVAVFCGQVLLTGLHFPQVTDATLPIVVGSACLLPLLLIQLYLASPETPLRSRSSYPLLTVQAVLVYLPVPFGLAWLPLPGFLAGSALLVMRPRVAWPVVVAVVTSAGLAHYAATGTVLESLYSSFSAVIHGAVVYGLTWMVRTVTELRATRAKLATAMVSEERRRFSRDLHDLLGLSLSAITLKSEVAGKLATRAPDRARAELTEILAISRLALTDVRLVAGGYRDLSLVEAVRTAESLLVSAGVDVRLHSKVGNLPEPVGTVLATVLREGVTNVLRHSKAARCDVSVERQERHVLLDIVNDGVVRTSAERPDGSGLGNLSYRVAMLGGELTSGIEPDGRFRLRVTVPTSGGTPDRTSHRN